MNKLFSINLIFYFFSVTSIASAFGVILSTNTVFSLIFLITSFIMSSYIFLILECEFLSLILIMIYVGAVGVMFLFVVMMLNFKKTNLADNKIKHFPMSVLLCLCLFLPIHSQINSKTFVSSCKHYLELETIYYPEYSKFYKDRILNIGNTFYKNICINWFNLVDSTHDINTYGQVLYTYYPLQVLISGLILLTVLIGIVYLVSTNKKQTKKQLLFKQLSRKTKIF